MAEEKEENQVLYASVRLPQLFHKLRKRGELIKMGVQIAIFKFSNLGLPEHFGNWFLKEEAT